MSKQNG